MTTPDPPIYLDYHATTPLDPRVLEAMLPVLSGGFGNAASSHVFGTAAAEHVERARAQVAALVGAHARDIVFTSGATEANNLAIKGVALAASERRHIVTTAVEHHSVLEPCRRLAEEGYDLDIVPVDRTGVVDPEAVRAALRPDTLLVTIGLANGEIGTIAPLAEISRAAHEVGALVHSDAAQAVGKTSVDVESLGTDLLSMSAHKLYGPMGIGALYVRREAHGRVKAVQYGGGHERGLRSGTINVPGAVGFGAACDIAAQSWADEAARLSELRDRLLSALTDLDVEVNGALTSRLPGNLNVRFIGVPNDVLMANCLALAISAGSACSSGAPEPSHVLIAIGRSYEAAEESVRFGLGRFTTAAEIDRAASLLRHAVLHFRSSQDHDEPMPSVVSPSAVGATR